MAIKPEIYFSIDIEADGGYPSKYSMLSIGVVACAVFDGKVFTRIPFSEENSYYSTMRPITDNFVPQAVEICRQGGIDRDELKVSGRHPESVMPELAQWIEKICEYRARPIGVVFPLWDTHWTYDYFERFSPTNPFGFSHYVDIKSFYIGRKRAMTVNATKRNIPNKYLSNLPHTHNALDDAREQGEMFCNLWEMP